MSTPVSYSTSTPQGPPRLAVDGTEPEPSNQNHIATGPDVVDIAQAKKLFGVCAKFIYSTNKSFNFYLQLLISRYIFTSYFANIFSALPLRILLLIAALFSLPRRKDKGFHNPPFRHKPIIRNL